MSNVKTVLSRILLFAIAFFLFESCQKESLPPDNTITANLFPLITGRAITYNRFEIDTAKQKVQGSDATEVFTVGSQTTVGGRAAFPLIDVISRGTTELKRDTIFIYRETNGDLMVYLSVNQTPIFLPPQWTAFVKVSAGVGTEYTILNIDTTYTIQGITGNLKLKVTGLIQGQESVTVPAGTLSAYKVRIHQTAAISIGGQTTAALANDQFFWFAADIGPVRVMEPAVATSFGVQNGYDQLMTSKNF